MIQMDISGNDCIHRIIIDYIDIDPDRSTQIIYCEKCFLTFHSIDRSIIKPLLGKSSDSGDRIA